MAIYDHIHLLISALRPANSFIVAIPYITIGRQLAQKTQKESNKRKMNVLLVISLILWVAEILLSLVNNSELALTTTDAMITLFIVTPLLVLKLTTLNVNISRNILKTLRHFSVLVYLIHGLVFNLLIKYAHVQYGMLLFGITLAISLFMAIVIQYLSEYIKILKWAY